MLPFRHALVGDGPCRQRIDSSEVFASAASIWEISIKSALGKLQADPNDVLGGYGDFVEVV
jgi:hypothetical protein